MLKKITAVLMMLALVLQVLPPYSGNNVSAATGSFSFSNESDVSNAPRITTEPRVTLTGSISNVNGATVSYDVVQIINNRGDNDPSNDQIGSKRENVTSNIYINGFNIQVYNIELFPGLNRITFKGVQGGGEVTNSIYINYHNAPVFYDLVAQLDGNRFTVEENGTTVVHSTNSTGKTSADISLTGFAPNAQSVTVITNNSSKTYNVSSSNNYQFAASPINVQQGKNLVTIRVKNADQTIETTREIAFYNGNVTFYDVNLEETVGTPAVTNKVALEYNPNFSAEDPAAVMVTGKVIVPNFLKDDSVPTDGILEPHPDPNTEIEISSTSTQTGTTTSTFNGSVYTVSPSLPVGQNDDAFFVYEFKTPLSTFTGGTPVFDDQYTLKLTAVNEKRRAQSLPYNEGTGNMSFSLRDGGQEYIEQINYLTGYTKDKPFENLTGSALDGINLFSIPFAMEVLIANPDIAAPTAELATVTGVTSITGATDSNYIAAPTVDKFENQSELLTSKFVYRDVNGVSKLFKREVIIFKKLPFEGTQTIQLDVGGVKKSVTFTMLFGPFTSYQTIFDNMLIYDDTNLLKTDRISKVITAALSDFKGQINNINNTSEIRYDLAANAAQTVFFYINNTPIRLKADSTDVTKFEIYDAAEKIKAFDALFSGENEIKFVFQGSKNAYEKKLKVYIVPTNLPVIPVDTALGIFPYASGYDEPLPNDPKFPKSGSIFNTTEASMNIFGTFDFIDLGNSTSLSHYTNKISEMNNPLNGLTAPNNYIFKIEGSSLAAPILWDLTNEFYVVNSLNDNAQIGIVNSTKPVENLTVRYDIATQSFSFIFANQKLNADGSSSVYNFTAYNNGLTGPKATYRLEVDPTSMPYTIVRPILPAKSIVNQNFLEVIIDAPVGTESVVINKIKAELIEFDSDNNPSTPEETYLNTYRAYLSNLKVGKNEIGFTIVRADDEVESSFEVTYKPTNIPGAQYLETMKNSHKIFEGAVNLKFPANTSLIRSDYNVPSNLKNQVFTGHNLLFAIANNEDGVVDRRELEEKPPGYDITLESFGTRFRLSYPTRFTKASPVYWIDAGLADDPNTSLYDPLTMGVDPYQFPGAKGTNGTKIPTYDERPDDRELITSKTGTLTLTFDPNMRDSIGTIITVYRYDVKAKYWENIGGVVNVKNNTITVPFNKFGYYVVGKMVYSFQDVTSHPYGRNFLEAIFAKGIMNAAGYDEFGTDIYVSRGEFARMIVKALDIPLNYELSKLHFNDVPSIVNPDALWDYRYIETAAREGIIRGTGPQTFQPSSSLTREEASVIIARALDLKLGTDTDKIKKDLDKIFKDGGNVEYYAKASVVAIAKKGFILGSPVDPSNPKAGYVFEPKSNLLRSDAAIIVARILADLKKLPKLN
ncbi:S-layer homology domain-containing protein [Paenibacillus sp. YIM B09110]|uniref:S-layer homology domain-containing protein n=1 Tax=Paenibacillus sp. YIM B09110 TaxID=3126102 RepID=UPI00301D996A